MLARTQTPDASTALVPGAVGATPREYDLVTGGTISYSQAELEELYAVQGGNFTLAGRNSYFLPSGSDFRIYIDTPLCGGCEGRLDNGVCHDCQLVYQPTGWELAEAAALTARQSTHNPDSGEGVGR